LIGGITVYLRKIVMLVFVALFAMGVLVAPAIADEKVIEWKLTAPDSAGVPRYELLNYFVDAVLEASGGRLVIKLFPAGALYPVFDSLDSVKMGVTEATITWGDYWVGKEPMLQLLTYRPCDPFKNLSEMNYFLSKYEPLVRETYSDLGVVYAGSVLAGEEVFHSNVEIKSLKDIKGLRVRASGLGQQLLNSLGASIVTMPMPEVYSAMQLGTLDAFESGGFATNWKYRYQEVTKFTMYPPIHMPAGLLGGQVLVNKKAWNELPDDLKNVVQDCADAARLNSWIQFKKLNKQARKQFEDAGNTVYSLPDNVMAEVRKAGVEVLLNYREKSPRSKLLIDIYQETLKELGYTELAAMF